METRQALIARYAAKGMVYDGVHVYRGMSFASPEATTEFVSRHLEGEIINYNAFTATSMVDPTQGAAADGGWGNKPVQIVITQAENTAGKHLDDFKKTKDEAELLYPPETTYRVDRIEKVEQEQLPERLDSGVKKLLLSKEAQKDSLTIKDLIGDLTPAQALAQPEFAWLAAAMKKRGIPDVTTWDSNSLVSSYFNLDKFPKGGALAVYNIASASLLPQV